MDSYLDEGIIEPVPVEDNRAGSLYYLPHGAVIRDDKSTTRFREHAVAITADIKQAFLQICIDPGDRDVTRFFWKDDPYAGEESVKIMRMTRVLFGVTSSPFLLSATIKHHLERTTMRSFLCIFLLVLTTTTLLAAPLKPARLSRNTTTGVDTPLCEKFGCTCTPPRGQQCCRGESYDKRAKKCRKSRSG